MISGTLVKDAGSYLLALGALLAAVLTLVGFATWVRGWYRRTLGRRRDRYERLGRLGTGAQLSFFVAVLGEPPAIRRTVTKADYVEHVVEGDPRFDPCLADPEDPTHEVRGPRDFTESFFIDRDLYVQAISNEDETVLAFSVTTRRPRFRPVFEMPPKVGWLERRRRRRRLGGEVERLFRVRLGRTRFAELDRDDFQGPRLLKVQVGARSFSYSELHYFGNPGNYVTSPRAARPAPRPPASRSRSARRSETSGPTRPRARTSGPGANSQRPCGSGGRPRSRPTPRSVLSSGRSTTRHASVRMAMRCGRSPEGRGGGRRPGTRRGGQRCPYRPVSGPIRRDL